MSAKSVTISVRVPQEDAEFIASLDVEGAATPSDKLRAMIAEARRHHQGRHDYRGAIAMMQDLLRPIGVHYREAEMTAGMHSELMTGVLDWLPDTLAYIVAGEAALQAGKEETLRGLEQGVADRVLRLAESILRMAVIRHCPCYDPNLLGTRVDPILDLAHVIRSMREPVQE